MSVYPRYGMSEPLGADIVPQLATPKAAPATPSGTNGGAEKQPVPLELAIADKVRAAAERAAPFKATSEGYFGKF